MIHLYRLILFIGPICCAQFNTVKPQKHIALIQKFTVEKVEVDTSRGVVSNENMMAFSFPLDTIRINSGFGNRLHPITGVNKKHLGIDLRSSNSYVHSVLLGRVKTVDYQKGYGFHIRIEKDGLEFLYAHLSEIYISEGDIVDNGEIIGKTGSTGLSTGDHLHFEVQMNKAHLDPIKFIKNLLQMSESNL